MGYAPEGVEPLEDFYLRVGDAWQNILSAHRGRHVLVVGHAGMMRMVIAHAVGLSPEKCYRINIENAVLSRIQVEWSEGLMLPTLLFHAGKL